MLLLNPTPFNGHGRRRVPPVAVRVAARTVPTAVVGVAGLCLLPVVLAVMAGGDDLQMSLSWASIVAGAGAGYAVDDAAAVTLAPSPTSLPRRRGLRAVTAAAILGSGWVAALVVGATSGPLPPWSELAPQLSAAAALSVALAGRAGQAGHAAPGFPSMAGAVVMMILTGALAARLTFLPTVGGAHVARWWWVAAAGAVAAARSWRDPA